MLSGCGTERPDPPDRSVVTTQLVADTALRYVPVEAEAVRDVEDPGWLPGDLTNGHLEHRIAGLELAVTIANLQFAAVRCLGGTIPKSPEADACLDALRAATGEAR